MIDLQKYFSNLEKNLPQAKIIERALREKEGLLGPKGSLIVHTGKYNGRCPKDRFLVEEENSKENIAWGKVNQKISRENFDKLFTRSMEYAKDKKFYLRDSYCGADKKHRIKVRFITQKAWHSMFIYNMFIEANPEELKGFQPDFTIINVGDILLQEYEKYNLNSEVFIIFDLEQKLGIIGGSNYSGEMKKGIFSYMNYLLPFAGVFPMHCSANKSKDGDVALFFGLSGTGKTTLSADTKRILIGDDEHGWSDTGVFNFEGGCYAKAIGISEESEPTIWNTIRYGAILENVVYDENTREVDFDNGSITENTRISYPISLVENADKKGLGGHPSNIIFLTADASGIFPPVARLTPKQASYHFLSGYTSKVPGTESGIKEFQDTFSTCFGEPFMVLRADVYSNLLEERVKKHGCNIFLVNTGWFGGASGVGHRISLSITREIITSILEGTILSAKFKKDEIFGFDIVQQIAGIKQNLNPQDSWDSADEYQQARKKLAQKFIKNFQRFGGRLPEIEKAGPKL